MESVKLILGKYLLGTNRPVLKDWGLSIRGSSIIEASPNGELQKKYPDSEIFDYTDKIVSPGFINAHNHFYGVLSHGITPPGKIEDFEGFLEDFWWPLVENRIDREMIEAAAAWNAWELLNSGVTTFCDILEAPNALPGGLEAAARVLKKAGIRVVLSFEACERVSTENGAAGLEENRNFFLEYKDHPLISGLMSIHTTFTCSESFITHAKKIADEIGSRFHMHLSESKYEPEKCLGQYGKLPVEVYRDLKVLDENVLASQGVKLTAGEIDILAERGPSVVHVPLSNCEVGGGVAPVLDLLARGITVALGTDGYINNFFEVMRGAFLIHKAYNENPDVMPASAVYKMATKNGGAALGMHSLGVFAPGAPADIIAIEPSFPTPVNEKNIFDQLILFTNPENVKEVFVNGKQVKSGGHMLALDRADLRKGVMNEAGRLWKEFL
jgi:5-methylthioadenosine/S-adenosylhomocysteine deaminase